MQIIEHPGAVSQFEAAVEMQAFCWLSILGVSGKGVVVTIVYGTCKSCEGHQNGSPGSLLSFPRLEPKATFIGSSP